jgi:hypothetical protein
VAAVQTIDRGSRMQHAYDASFVEGVHPRLAAVP